MVRSSLYFLGYLVVILCCSVPTYVIHHGETWFANCYSQIGKAQAPKSAQPCHFPSLDSLFLSTASSARDHYESKIFGPSLKFHWIVLNSFQEENKNCRVYTRRDREEKARGWSSITLTGHRVCSTREDWQWSEASWSGPWGWRNEFAFSLNFTCLNGDRAQKKLSQL
jgi:hypothetical protein